MTNTQSASPALARSTALDVIRGVAVLMVLSTHSPVFIPFLTNTGWLGVDLFFLVSGFLISGLLFREFQSTGRIDLLRFYVRRAAKIYPLFWLVLALVPWTLGPQPVDAWLSELFFVQDYLPGVYGFTWSLAVEEHFYLALPVFLILLTFIRRTRVENPFRSVPWVALGCLTICTLFRLVTAIQLEHAHIIDMEPLRNTHTRGDLLMMGVGTGYLYAFHRERTRQFIKKWHLLFTILPAICGVMALGVASAVVTYSVGIPLLTIGGAAMIFTAGTSETSASSFGSRLLADIGRSSYALYLFHVPVTLLLFRIPLFRANVSAILLSYFGANILVGMGLTRYFEQPVLIWRDRLFPGHNTRSRQRKIFDTAPMATACPAEVS